VPTYTTDGFAGSTRIEFGVPFPAGPASKVTHPTPGMDLLKLPSNENAHTEDEATASAITLDPPKASRVQDDPPSVLWKRPSCVAAQTVRAFSGSVRTAWTYIFGRADADQVAPKLVDLKTPLEVPT
jgi:hypothetical protein